MVTEAVRVVVAAVFVADGLVLVGTTAESAGALVERGDVAGVRSKCGGAGVGFPDVHFVAAGAVVFEVGLEAVSTCHLGNGEDITGKEERCIPRR